MNTDASVKTQPGIGGLGGMIRNLEGNWIIGFSRAINHSSLLQDELMAILEGLKLALQRSLTPLVIETDSLLSLKSITHQHTPHANIISECRSLMLQLGAPELRHIYREQNRVADALEKEGAKSASFDEPQILIVPPMYANQELNADRLGTTFPRIVVACSNLVSMTVTITTNSRAILAPSTSEKWQYFGRAYFFGQLEMVLINETIGRDFTFWEDPLMFKPERFWSSDLDIQGQHFELISFSAGRRTCPGYPMTLRMIPVILGSLLNSFNWKLEADIEPKDLDMEEKFGLTLVKAHPL
ncbi:flavonoid 3'-monooxygenase-like [Capsicum annuum]|uniref:flavonoid 3'-monooxygenase-like n=1 Tax=Capsicum annuum TaxID=4072 RepID=UPI001FB11BF2|nr:flavonoid 3'-monooxygenase-like [Capsicum annuum]